MPNPNEYQVEGYGEHKPYDSDYHPNAYLDPSVHFAFGGNNELQDKWQEDLYELKAAKDAAETEAWLEGESPRPPQEDAVLKAQREKTGKEIGREVE